MGLSETIVAAMIGAVATVTTALFQIFSSMKSSSKPDVKPRRGSTTRSVFAVIALMIASAVGGFLYSELLKQGEREEFRALRMELRELKELATASRAREAVESLASAPVPADAVAVRDTASVPPNRAESVAYVPACRRIVEGQASAACSEAEAQRIALCGTIPSYARIEGIDLFAQPDAVQHPWEQHRATWEQDLGGARFTGKSFEYAQGEDLKAVCVNFAQWSSEHSHIARIVVNYGFGDLVLPGAGEPADTTHPVIAAETPPALPQALPQRATFVTSTKP